MKFVLLGLIFCGLSLGIAQEDPTNFLIRVCPDSVDDFGARAGYADRSGRLIVPINAYFHCYTDTIKTIGIVLEHNGGCLAIDTNGKELYQVFWYDNGPDTPSEGLFRIVIDGRTGYAAEDGRIIIPPRFKCSTPFKKGKAKVALDCELISRGEYTGMDSDSWFFIDKNGNRID